MCTFSIQLYNKHRDIFKQKLKNKNPNQNKQKLLPFFKRYCGFKEVKHFYLIKDNDQQWKWGRRHNN